MHQISSNVEISAADGYLSRNRRPYSALVPASKADPQDKQVLAVATPCFESDGREHGEKDFAASLASVGTFAAP
jgi:hypothetical protein